MSTIVAVVFALPLSWMGFTGFFTWLSPFIMLNSVFVLKSFVWLNLIALVLLVFILFRERWFCRNLCPVGWGCDQVSSYSHRKKSSYKRLPEMGKWLAITSLIAAVAGFPLFILFDPMAIFNGFFTIFSGHIEVASIISLSGLPALLAIHLFYPGIWCKKICPLGGLQMVAVDIKNQTKGRFFNKKTRSGNSDAVRRLLLRSGIGLLAGLAIPQVLKATNKNHIRPPASVEPDLYNTLCIRCGNCIKACPTKIINHHTGSDNLLAWMTPEVVFEKGYCLETCNLCSQVCPSGSITLFNVEAKKDIFMATAKIHLDKCLLSDNTECDRCKVACKYEAVDIVPGIFKLQMQPEIITEKCVGCGACAVICPASTIEMKQIPGNALS